MTAGRSASPRRSLATEGSLPLHVRIGRVDALPLRWRRPGRCLYRETSESLVVRVQEVRPPRRSTEVHPLPAQFSIEGGTQEADGSVVFRTGAHDPFVEAPLRPGWRLRFEVLPAPGASVAAFAEIGIQELAERAVWRLLLSDPGTEDAAFSPARPSRHPSSLAADESPPEARRPAFIEVVVEQQRPPAHSSPHVPGGGARRSRWPLEDARKRVMIMTRGTRGDVQPYVALARGLVEHHDCEVTIVTELVWKRFILDSVSDLRHGSVHFRPSGGNTMKQTQSQLSVTALRLGQHVDAVQAIALSNSEKNFYSSEGCFFYWAWEEQPDFLVFGFTVTEVAMIISEALQIPLVGFFLQPVHEIEPRQHPSTIMDQLLGPVRNAIDSEQFNATLMQIMEKIPDGGHTVNSLRLSRGLGRRPRGIYDFFLQYHELSKQGIPQIVPISEAVLGESQAGSLREAGMTPTSFIFLRCKGSGLDKEVTGFIDRARSEGRPVAVMSFSSMPVGERKMLRAVAAACKQCPAGGQVGLPGPAIIAMVGGQGFDPVPDNSTLSDDVKRLCADGQLLVLRRGVDFGALFPRLDAAIVHGGLGITSEALAAGIAVVVSGILLLDQRYWAGRVRALECGPDGVYVDRLLEPGSGGAPRIAELMTEALYDHRWAEGAKRVKSQLLAVCGEGDIDGVALNAKAVFEAGLQAKRIEAAYARHNGCEPQKCIDRCQRQGCCAVHCLVGCINWLLCKQCRSCAWLGFSTLRFLLCCTCKACPRRLCGKGRRSETLLDSSLTSEPTAP